MFPRDCCCVQSLLATIQFRLLYIHTSCPGDAWHSRGATHWSLPLVQECYGHYNRMPDLGYV